jgi:integrase
MRTLLRKAVEWNEIAAMPCTISLLRNPRASAKCHDFDQFEKLVQAARNVGPNAEMAVLLGGEARLRLGEMVALEWRDVDLQQQQICVERSEWKGQVTAPKGGRLRRLRLTNRLVVSLRRHRHLRCCRVVCNEDGQLSAKVVSDLVRRAAVRAGLQNVGVHVLRHTFCSHLAMKGAPATSIQELAGHRDLATTQRYMHLSPAALDSAVRLLDGRRGGNISETAAEAVGM